jgi:DNA recombination protein RmuC
MWRQEEQTRNSLAIAKQAGNLYDKFIGFLEAFEEIGARLDQSRDVWETARNRLSKGRGNLVSRAEKLKNLGVQSSKILPQSMSVDQDKNHPDVNKQTPATGG